MKNNALKLISLAVLLPMMTACPKKTNKAIWSAEIDEAMMLYCGEVLPFAELDKDSIQFGYDGDYSMFYIMDDNEVNVLENYADTLVEAGFEEVENDYYGLFTYVTYDKTNDLGFISVSFGFDEGDAESGTLPGNYINVTVPAYIDEALLAEYGYTKQQGWPAALVGETLEGTGITMAPVNANGEWWVADELYVDEDDGSSYYCAYLATKGDFFDDVSDDLLGKGLTYDEDYGCFYDASGSTDAEIYVSIMRDYTVINVYGQTLEPPLPDVASETNKQDGSIDVAFTFSGALVNQTVYEETFESTSASCTVAKGGNANNAPTYYDSGSSLRCYYKNTLTITAAPGLTINSAVIEVGFVKNLSANDMTASSGTLTSTGTAAPATITISGVNAASLTITVGPNASKGSIGISSITVNVSSAR